MEISRIDLFIWSVNTAPKPTTIATIVKKIYRFESREISVGILK